MAASMNEGKNKEKAHKPMSINSSAFRKQK
jgi:hypothetical protein